jgi:hypothetical protein
MPQNLSTGLRVESGEQILLAEIAAEQACALGRTGRIVESVLKKLKASGGSVRDDLVGEAAEAVWNYFVQREVMGLANHDQAVAHYDIPGDVLARVGARHHPRP